MSSSDVIDVPYIFNSDKTCQFIPSVTKILAPIPAKFFKRVFFSDEYFIELFESKKCYLRSKADPTFCSILSLDDIYITREQLQSEGIDSIANVHLFVICKMVWKTQTVFGFMIGNKSTFFVDAYVSNLKMPQLPPIQALLYKLSELNHESALMRIFGISHESNASDHMEFSNEVLTEFITNEEQEKRILASLEPPDRREYIAPSRRADIDLYFKGDTSLMSDDEYEAFTGHER